MQHLDEHGFCVVAGVLERERGEIEAGTAMAWDMLETNPPGTSVRREDITTWYKEWLPDPDNGILSGFGFNHSEFLWFIRQRPKVRQAFEAVWNSTNLLVSYDGANFFRPHAHPAGDPTWKTSGGWWHVDQNGNKPGHEGKCCVQGVVLLTDADASSGGLCVIPGSHREFTNLCQRNALAKANKSVDYIPIPYDDAVLDQEKGWSGVLVGAKAGDMILWDSRTVHCNTPSFDDAQGVVSESLVPSGDTEEGAALGGSGAETAPPASLLRLAAYVCMTPAAWATNEAIDERISCYQDKHGSSHWPHCFKRAGAAPPTVTRSELADAPLEVQNLVHGGRHRRNPRLRGPRDVGGVGRGKCVVC